MTPFATLIFLRSFCSFYSSRMPEVLQPWADSNYAYASNRHWLVRIPLHAIGEVKLQPPPVFHPKVLDLFAGAAGVAMSPMEPIPANACTDCGGTGYAHYADCTACNGVGCDACKGRGEFVTPALHPVFTPDAPAPRCFDCDATGFACRGSDGLMEYRGARFQRHYLAHLSRVPCEFSTHVSPESPAAFRFEGGAGLLVTCHAPGTAIPVQGAEPNTSTTKPESAAA